MTINCIVCGFFVVKKRRVMDGISYLPVWTVWETNKILLCPLLLLLRRKCPLWEVLPVSTTMIILQKINFSSICKCNKKKERKSNGDR
jgi:hypothetical protein